MDEFWQVTIGAAICGVIFSLWGLLKGDGTNKGNKLAKWSIFFGISGIFLVFIGSIIGIIFALISMRGSQNKTISKIGLFISIITMLPWILVILFGP